MTAKRNFIPKGIFFIALCLFLFSSVSYGQSKSEQFDELLGLYHEYGQFNGSVLIAEGGEVIYKKGFGMANMEWKIPNEANTKHRLGSITKQFTAMLILQLAADDKLDLHAPISQYLPDYPKENGDKITCHHLLTHTSGIPSYTSFPNFMEDESRNPYSPDEFVKKFDDKALEFKPGEQFNYSNSGYFLLGVIIEKISGMSYEKMLHEKIFKPLNMNNSGYDHHRDILERRASGYEKQGNSFVNARYLDMSLPYAAGSLYSSVEDLYLWDQALYTEKLLPQKYMEMYFTPYIPAFGPFSYAYGWGVGEEAIGNSGESIEVITHSGGINGFNTNISRSTKDKSLIVLLNNTGGAPLSPMTQAIRAIMYGKTYDLPRKSLAFDLVDIIEAKGIQAAREYFDKNKDSDEFILNENEMNQVGYQLMNEGKVEEAAKVFKWNIDAFPSSFNVYDSYAEAMMNLGKNEQAIAYYKKSLELNPGNQNGIDMLAKLGVAKEGLVKEVVIEDEILKSYEGDYELMPGFVLTIFREGKQMRAQATGQQAIDIFPRAENVFFAKIISAQITFNKGADGKIESLTLLQGGQEIPGKKILK